MKKIVKSSVLVLTGIALTGCASLISKDELKAPCGPTAGLTDPCGNRIPINSFEDTNETQIYLKYRINRVEA